MTPTSPGQLSQVGHVQVGCRRVCVPLQEHGQLTGIETVVMTIVKRQVIAVGWECPWDRDCHSELGSVRRDRCVGIQGWNNEHS